MKAVICPVCEGTGIYTKVVSHCPLPECCGEEVDTQCHGCDGDGWVQVEECDCEPCKCPCHVTECWPTWYPYGKPYPYFHQVPVTYPAYPAWDSPVVTITC